VIASEGLPPDRRATDSYPLWAIELHIGRTQVIGDEGVREERIYAAGARDEAGSEL